MSASEGLCAQWWLIDRARSLGIDGTPTHAYLMKAARSIGEDYDRADIVRHVRTVGTSTKKDPRPAAVVAAMSEAAEAISAGEHMSWDPRKLFGDFA